MALISCEGVSMAYGGRAVLSGIDFNVGAGDCLCIVGENGSGKSTLVKGLLRLLPIASGRVTYGDGFVPGRVGYVAQNPSFGADFPAGVYEVVLSGRLARCGLMPFYTKNDKEAAIDSMKRLGIDGLKNKCFNELSGGQRQRVLLARALCAAESLLVLDEPVSGLDPAAAQDFYDTAKELHSSGMSIIMVSHDVERAVAGATHVLKLEGGRGVFSHRDEYLKFRGRPA